MQKKTSQRDSFKKEVVSLLFLIVDKETSKVVKLVLDYLWVGKLQSVSRLLDK